METRTIAQRLALAETRVLHADAQLSRQRTLIRHLQRHGLGTLQARRLLKELEETQASLVAERDRLESKMAVSGGSPAAAATSAALDSRAV